jgi:hypothetical protein
MGSRHINPYDEGDPDFRPIALRQARIERSVPNDLRERIVRIRDSHSSNWTIVPRGASAVSNGVHLRGLQTRRRGSLLLRLQSLPVG